ncbi:family 2 glycosyl transferase [Nitzschia inconspicua]|uniref:Family 2 glycosyl transferase n=1 Tax=Nitzschia inconspicua TaxID=303405 RepID=A0A9K3M2F9_9STRA|nr:family 2 glycosyl transferase [Nitzschia inconspicua]
MTVLLFRMCLALLIVIGTATVYLGIQISLSSTPRTLSIHNEALQPFSLPLHISTFQQGVLFDDKHQHPIDQNNIILPRILAFVFPQFHADPLNDEIWGEGFTDWDSLRSAPTHNRLGYKIPRPVLDTDGGMGYYNYTEFRPRQQHGELARQYGIDGLVFHHYWFYDRKHPGPTLAAPLEALLQDGQPNVPFALHWCASEWNSKWNAPVFRNVTRYGNGMLQPQYFPKDPKDHRLRKHYQWLSRFFHHPNYIKVDGRPLFMVYRRKKGLGLVLEKLQEFARKDGFPNGLYLTVGVNKPHKHLLQIRDWTAFEEAPETIKANVTFAMFDKIVAYPNPTDWSMNRSLVVPRPRCVKKRWQRTREIAGIISAFDNTPRRSFEEARVWSSLGPESAISKFQASLSETLKYETCCFSDSQNSDTDDRFVLVNAMNEWGEGMVLEPSDVYGRQLLESIRYAKEKLRRKKCTEL